MSSEKIGELLVDEVVVGLSNHLVNRRTEESLEARIAEEVDTLEILEPHQIGQCSDQGAQLGLALLRVALADPQARLLSLQLMDSLLQLLVGRLSCHHETVGQKHQLMCPLSSLAIAPVAKFVGHSIATAPLADTTQRLITPVS